MLTDKDIKKLTEVLPTRTKVATNADAYFQEMVMLSHKVDRLEKWIQQVARKVGVQLEA